MLLLLPHRRHGCRRDGHHQSSCQEHGLQLAGPRRWQDQKGVLDAGGARCARAPVCARARVGGGHAQEEQPGLHWQSQHSASLHSVRQTCREYVCRYRPAGYGLGDYMHATCAPHAHSPTPALACKCDRKPALMHKCSCPLLRNIPGTSSRTAPLTACRCTAGKGHGRRERRNATAPVLREPWACRTRQTASASRSTRRKRSAALYSRPRGFLGQ